MGQNGKWCVFDQRRFGHNGKVELNGACFFFTGSNSDIKLKVVLPGVSLDYCNSVFRQEGVTVGDTQICAGGEAGKDSCRGIYCFIGNAL